MRLFTSARRLSSPPGVLSLCVLSLLVAQAFPLDRLSVSASQQPSAQPLTPGVPLERQLAGGQTHLYQLAFGAEECVKIAVEQRGVDVTLALVDRSGTLLREENRLGNQGTEWLLWISPGPGLYQLAVSARDPRAPSGTYQVRVEFSTAEESRKLAFQEFSEGWRLVQQGGESSARALRNFEDALPYWRTSGDREIAAVTLRELGSLNEKLKNAPLAFDDYQQALALFRELGRNTEAALVLNDLGVAYGNQGAYPKALENYAAAMALADALSPDDAADLMLNHGVALEHVSKHQDALDLLQRALTAFGALGRKERELEALSEIGRTHYAAGEMVQSLEYANQGLARSRAYKIPLSEARFAQDIGRVFQYLEDYEKAREYCEQALRLFRGEKYVNGEIATLLLLGDTQYDLEDNAAAQESYETAARLAGATQFAEAEARAAARLGTLLSEKGEFASAVEYRQRALAFYRATGNRRSEVEALRLLGRTHHQMGNLQEASALLQQGLQISRDAAGGFAETRLLGELALVARDKGSLEEAEEHLEAVLSKFDAERRSLLAPGLSATFGSGAQNWYGIYADLLMRLHEAHPEAGYDRRAWQAAEHAKAWGLLEMLAEARTDLRQGVDPALLEKRRRLWDQLSTRAATSQRSGERSASSERADQAAKAINDLTVQLQLVETELRAASPGYVALVQPEPLSTAELQARLLDDDTVLLEFSLDDTQSWLWAVTRKTFDSYKLAPRPEIEAGARRLYGLLTARQPKPGVPQAQRRALIAGADARLPSAAVDVSRLLLGPIAARLRQEWKGKRLVIVASGALEYLPFGALPQPAGPVLLAEHEVLNLPSASVLASLRDEAAGRTPAKRMLALFADPVFDSGDPRVARAGRPRAAHDQPGATHGAGERATTTTLSDASQRRVAGSFTRAGFARLPFSHAEAAAIADLVPRGSLLEATGFQANHALAVSGELSQYRFVHFATHGLLNSRHPELSGLVLSLVNETGQAQNGFLRLQEIYNLQLPADVVVLSACQTALGKEIKGEGLVGLTRGFMYAGAQRVVASLWEVDDLATAELMKAFYRGMLKDGLRPAAALRSAQLEMMKQERWASPYYWSAFILQGEWR